MIRIIIHVFSHLWSGSYNKQYSFRNKTDSYSTTYWMDIQVLIWVVLVIWKEVKVLMIDCYDLAFSIIVDVL